MTTTAQGRVYCEKPIIFVLRVIASELKNAVRLSSRARTLSPRVAYLRTARAREHGNAASLLRISNEKLPHGLIYIIQHLGNKEGIACRRGGKKPRAKEKKIRRASATTVSWLLGERGPTELMFF